MTFFGECVTKSPRQMHEWAYVPRGDRLKFHDDSPTIPANLWMSVRLLVDAPTTKIISRQLINGSRTELINMTHVITKVRPVKKIFEILIYPYTEWRRRKVIKRRIAELKKKDPFIYK